jgi:hypothetical protein
LRNEFSAELSGFARRVVPPSNLSDIRDDPWFWSIGRPLAIAAIVAVFALLSAILISKYSRQESVKFAQADETVIEAENSPSHATVNLPVAEPERIPNPLPIESISRTERVVIGEIINDPQLRNAELHPIETINDLYRLARLKQRLSVPVVSKESSRGPIDHSYGLIFLDPEGRIIASARFYCAIDSEFVLQPLENAYEQDGRYFMAGGEPLPGKWKSDVDYRSYIIQFPDWKESVGYAPQI